MPPIHSQPDIILLGLGPGNPDLLTLRAAAVLETADEIYTRTADHPSLAELPERLTVHSFDKYYEAAGSYLEVYPRITAEIIRLALEAPVIYAVPGDPFIAEDTPEMILTEAEKQGLTVEVVPGLSFLEPSFAAICQDPLPQTTIADAHTLGQLYLPTIQPDRPVLIAQISSRQIASDLKLVLTGIYPDNHHVMLIHEAGTGEEQVEGLPLYEIDRSDLIGNRSTLYLPPLPTGSSLESFQELIAHLRSPEGCPWDREQDHQSLRINLLEEAYETLEAIDQDDPNLMREELGDLLLQIVLQAQIASEMGEFNLNQVILGIHRKIVSRHPHVFEDLELDQAGEVIQNWEALKKKEREASGRERSGALAGLPSALPALAQAQSYQKRAARVGFDWEDLEGVLAKLPEEIQELQGSQELSERENELGDILFTVVNIARWLDLDAESALRGANQRFKRRFRFLEEKARAEGRELNQLSLEEMDRLWEQSKLKSTG